MKRRRILIVGLLGALLTFAVLWTIYPTSTKYLHCARYAHQAVLLANGDVLVIGGVFSPTPIIDEMGAMRNWIDAHFPFWPFRDRDVRLTSCELFDHETHLWTTVESLNDLAYSAVLLPNGSVLKLGLSAEIYEGGHWKKGGPVPEGSYQAISMLNGQVLATTWVSGPASIYHPESQTWTKTGFTTMDFAAVTPLANGEVLAAGGQYPLASSSFFFRDDSEVFDPVTGAWKKTADMQKGRQCFNLVALSDGRALAVGGQGFPLKLNECELFDPKTDTWTQTGDLKSVRMDAQAVRLQDGRVLVMGGEIPPAGSCELYDPKTGLWSDTGRMLDNCNSFTATVLEDGQVLVTGGYSGFHYPICLSSCELYDPKTGTWSRL